MLENHSYENFKTELEKRELVIYDTYQGDKRNSLDMWLKKRFGNDHNIFFSIYSINFQLSLTQYELSKTQTNQFY